ncbi:MAG: hypothetical protein EA425_06495 [Puniceicoccaceae bacterium]|nr:MAG: hypothetical protein EA425_06495 [Puniceicoccaceae bacterium]
MRIYPLLSILTAGLACSAVANTLTLDPDRRHQHIDGFGTCLVSWGSYPEIYDEDFARIYVREMGCSMLRVELSGGTLPEPIEDVDAIRHEDFLMSGYTGSTEVFVGFAQKIRALDPEIKIIGTVWTPPPWMKYSNALGDPELAEGRRSGSIRANTYRDTRNYVQRKYYPHMVRWLVEFAKLYEAAGVPLYAISPGNEVKFTQWFQSCVWTAEDFATIVAMLGEGLEAAGYGHIKIFGPETMTGHNWGPEGNQGYLDALRKNPTAWKHLDIIATHGYVDGFAADMSATSSAEFWNLIKDDNKTYWMTEGGTGPHQWPAPLTNVAAAIHNSLVTGNASAFVPWQIAENNPSTHALMVNREMTKKSQAARHYFRFIRPGAHRVSLEPADGAIKASAYLHPEHRTLTMVFINPEERRLPIDVDLGGLRVEAFEVYQTTETEDLARRSDAVPQAGRLTGSMPPQSMITLVGRDLEM